MVLTKQKNARLFLNLLIINLGAIYFSGCGKGINPGYLNTLLSGGNTAAATPTPSGPFLQQGSKLVGTGATGATVQQGYSVTLSADGNTMAQGGDLDNSGVGAVWVYTRSGTSWTQQGSKLVGTGASGASNQGVSVSLSADGNTLAVGGFGDNSSVGAVWVFTRSGSTWTQQGSKLVGSAASGASNQGYTVSLSADGNTLVEGGYNDNSGIGGVWVFTRSAGSWSQQGAKLIATGATGAANQGTTVAVSGDGNTFVEGGNADNSGVGGVWVFTRSAGTWTQQGTLLVGSGATGSANQGTSVSMSSDGNTFVEGGYNDDSGIGAMWVFTRSAGAWSQQGSKLVGTGGNGASNQGNSVFLSSDGNTIVESGYADDSGNGAVWSFTRSAGVWSQLHSLVIGTGAVGSAYQGVSVTTNADGTTLAEGGYGDDSAMGGVWIFKR